MVDRTQPTQQKRRIHQIILNKNQKRNPEHEDLLPYEVETSNRFRQTMAGGFKTNRPTRHVSRGSQYR